MTADEEQFLKIGREVVRMIHDLRSASGQTRGYARRKFTFPGGEVHLLIANEKRLADLFDAVAAGVYDVAEATPPSQRN